MRDYVIAAIKRRLWTMAIVVAFTPVFILLGIDHAMRNIAFIPGP